MPRRICFTKCLSVYFPRITSPKTCSSDLHEIIPMMYRYIWPRKSPWNFGSHLSVSWSGNSLKQLFLPLEIGQINSNSVSNFTLKLLVRLSRHFYQRCMFRRGRNYEGISTIITYKCFAGSAALVEVCAVWVLVSMCEICLDKLRKSIVV